MWKTFLLCMLMITGSYILVSCEKVIDINTNESEPQLVVEAVLTDEREPQYIKLSQSVPYTSDSSYPGVSGAMVSVTDSNTGAVYPFKEIDQTGVYRNTQLRAKLNNKYILNINYQGNAYSAVSTRPAKTLVDSLTVTELSFAGNKTLTVAVHFKDSAGIANQYRFVQFINGKQVNQVYTRNDRFFDGNNVKIELYRFNEDDDDKLKSGDTVVVEMQCIDQEVYKYWYSLSQQEGGNTVPSNPVTNITGGALGYFSAHTTQYLKVEIP